MTDILYYHLVPVREKDLEDQIMTAAILSCKLCGVMVDGMGGPGCAICPDCVKLIRQGKITKNA